jgi:poly-gamma-glutamate biosynthesis protein PgsC/CapC
MYDYAFDVNLTRFAIVLGVFMTILFYERLKIAPGGMVVPGYIALFINHPEQIMYTFILSFFVYLIVGRILMKRTILFGKRRFTITILTGAVFAIVAESIVYFYAQFEPFTGFSFVGIIVPGLIANEFIRERKPVYVSTAILLISTLTFGFIWTILQMKLLLSSANPNMISLGISIVYMALLVGVTTYFLFLFDWEKYFGHGPKMIERIKSSFKNRLHFSNTGG